MNKLNKMKFVFRFLFASLIIFSLFNVKIYAEENQRFEKEISELLKRSLKPGLAAVKIENGELKKEYYIGYKNIERKELVTDSTIFNIGSISKVFTVIGVMQLVEKGELDLDEDINNYLDFKVKNHYFPNSKITLRMLLTHTSTIDNNWIYVMSPLLKEGDSDCSLKDFIKGYMEEGGIYYHKNNFLKREPGTKYFKYSNTAVCLAAYIVERKSQMDFEEYTRKFILIPLEMNNSSFLYKNLDKKKIAMPYEYFLWKYFRKELYSSPFYPAGFMKSTAKDMANLLIMISRKGKFKNREIMKEETFEKMIECQKNVKSDDWDEQALIFQIKHQNGYKFIGHTGGLYGIATMMYYSPENDKGVILLMNGSWKNMFEGNRMKEKEIRKIFFKIYNK